LPPSPRTPTGGRRMGGAQHGSDSRDGMQSWDRSRPWDGTQVRPVGTARMMNRAPGPCPHMP
jgi:hypothetical protein